MDWHEPAGTAIRLFVATCGQMVCIVQPKSVVRAASETGSRQKRMAMDSAVSRRSSHAEPVPDAEFGHTTSEVVPRRCTLDGFAEEVALTEGINVREAEPLVPIVVTTQNSVYRIIPLRWGDAGVLVQGGQFFPEPTEAYLAGSTFGGSFLKMYWIGIGMHMEINTGNGVGPIITTRVASVRIERDQTTKARRH